MSQADIERLARIEKQLNFLVAQTHEIAAWAFRQTYGMTAIEGARLDASSERSPLMAERGPGGGT